jgi:signal transduction histidine kinase
MFERLDATYPGTGVGLAIVKRAVERMGGRVGFEPGEERGSRFWIELPLAENDG